MPLDAISSYLGPVKRYEGTSLWDQTWDAVNQNQNSRKIQLPHLHDTLQPVKAKSKELGYVDLDTTTVIDKRPKLRTELQLSKSSNDKTGGSEDDKGVDRKILRQIFAAITVQREQRKTALTMVMDKLQNDAKNHQTLMKEQQDVATKVNHQSVTDRILSWVSWIVKGAFVLAAIVGLAAVGATGGLAAAGAVASYAQTASAIMQTMLIAAQGVFKSKMDKFNQELEKMRLQIDKAQKKIKADQGLITSIHQEQTKADKLQKEILDSYHHAMRGMFV